ncbi:unnamed protein product [Sympodiomycopsis kandeliae]
MSHRHDSRSRSRTYSPSLPKDRARSPTPSGSKSRSPSYSPPRDVDRSPRGRDRSPKDRDRSPSVSSSSSSSSSSRPPQSISKSIKITNLTEMVLSWHLQEIFQVYGKIQDIFLDRRSSSSSSSSAWIVFISPGPAKKAIDCMHQGQIDGAVVSVSSSEVPRDLLNPLRRGYRGTSDVDDRRYAVPSPQRSYRDHHHYSRQDYYRPPPPPSSYDRRQLSRSPSRSYSPPPKKLHKQRSISRSLSPRRRKNSYDQRRYSGGRSRSRSRTRTRSRSWSRSRSRSRSVSPRRR